MGDKNNGSANDHNREPVVHIETEANHARNTDLSNGSSWSDNEDDSDEYHDPEHDDESNYDDEN